jgi:DNA-binding NarL/FixJ family response regulator
MEKKKILIVDDEKLIRDMISDHLELKYQAETAENAEKALKIPHLASFDLVISDINMPGMPGYELLKHIKEKFPKTKVVLITAYDVDDYIRMAKEHGICNIISKTVPFNFKELDAVVDGLLSGDIFGLERYMAKNFQKLKEYSIKSSADAKEVREDILKLFLGYVENTGELRLVLDEIVTNALYHSPKDSEGREKYKEFSNIQLAENEFINITCAIDDEKYGVAIADNQGTLSKNTVLYKIDRHIRGEGVLDDSGRGIFMSRIFADRLLVNIDPGKRTEMIILNYRKPLYHGFKPLYINEL